MDRRDFLKASAAATALAGVQSFSFSARAALTPARARLGHLAGGAGKDPTVDAKILADLLARLREPIGPGEAADVSILTSGPLNAPESAPSPAFRILILGPTPAVVELHDQSFLKDWIAKNGGGQTPLVLATARPLDLARSDKRAEAERRELLKILPNYPEFVLVLSGGVNRAAWLPGGPLSLCTASALVYPCGGRKVSVEVGADGGVKIESRFVQSRLLQMVEESYIKGAPDVLKLSRLGGRPDRELTAVAAPGIPGHIEPVKFDAGPNLAPWPATASRLDLAIVTDTHLVLDKFLAEGDAKTFALIGHALEQDSKALIADVLGQVAEGRHRVEFYDQVFAQDPQADKHFLNRPVEGLLLLGDITENGRLEEAEQFKGLLDGLPARLRERTVMVPGNHDLWAEMSPGGMATDRAPFLKTFSDYGLSRGTNYVVELSDWCTLIMLDSVIATISAMGCGQEHIDWLEDQLERQKGKVVMIGSHHDLYQLSLVPPALFAYLRTQSHFTGKESAAREQLHRLFAKHNCVKLCLSGHYHSVVADEWKKGKGVGDPFTVHLQTPCVTEYPSGYRVLRLAREGAGVRAEYYTAYTRLWEIRAKSLNAWGYRIAGTKPRMLPGYQGTLEALKKQGGVWGEFSRLDPYDLTRLNMRGFKDGTAHMGRGNGKLFNISDHVDFTL